MSNQVTDKSLEKLLEYYKNAKESVIENIRAVRQRNGNDFYLRQALTQIEKELDKLYKQNKKWFEQQSELAFRRGYNQFSREIGRTASVEGAVNFVKMNNDAVEMLSQSATSNIGDALRQIKYNALYAVNKIGRRQDDVIADVGIKASAEALAVNAPSAAREQIIRDLAEKDIFSVTYRNGAKVSAEDYASMVARTTTHEAATTAKLIAAEQEGYDLVKMSTHYPTCKTCAQLQGRVYSISGKDKRFPPLSKAFKSGYNTVHPNCRHVVSVWAEEIKTNEEIKEASENSLKPFDIDPRSEKERELYASQQKAKRKVDKEKKSGIINLRKSVEIPSDCNHLLKADTNFSDKEISIDVLKTIDKSIDEQLKIKSDFKFDEVKIAKFSDDDKSVFITNYEVGAHSKTQLYLNKRFFLGVSEKSINDRCKEHYESNWWKSKSLKDLVNHEIMHAKINNHNSYEKAERLYQTLREDLRVKGFCRLVDNQPEEFMNEMYVAMNNGEKIKQEYIDVYNEYAKEFLGE